MSERLRSYLQMVLAKKMETSGLVVWDDPAQEYGREVAQAVCPPPPAGFESWDGSWYDLRHKIEARLGADAPPMLVVYLPVVSPPSDPLAEAREAGTNFKLRLETLVRQSLAGQLTESRLNEIGRQSRTLLQAEAAVQGAQPADVQLISVLGNADTVQMILAFLADGKDQSISGADAWQPLVSFAGRSLGADFAGTGEDLRRGIFRHLILIELSERLGQLPQGLVATWSQPSAEQRHCCLGIVEAWRRDRVRVPAYARLATQFDADLSLAGLAWNSQLADIDGTPAIERLAFIEAVRLLAANDLAGAKGLANKRLEQSLWARVALDSPLEGADLWGPRWRVVVAIAGLRASAATLRPPQGETAKLLRWYADTGWAVDRDHRMLELALTELQVEGELEEHIGTARAAYEEWLDTVINVCGRTAERWADDGSLLSQSHIHAKIVAPQTGPTAYVWVDALRFELGVDLAEKLRPICPDVVVQPAVAAMPTITPVGMANLCPGADEGLFLDVGAKSQLVVRIGDLEVKDVPARVGLLRAAHGQVVDLQLAEVVSRGEKELAKRVEGASLVLVRSQEIDATGEAGMLTTTWDGFETANQQLVRAVARLIRAGIRRFVISADHGFIALSRGLRPDRLVDKPTGGTGELHARSWVGKGAITNPELVRVALADTGVNSDLDLLAPAHLAVFKGPWTRQFFHGGISPQELVIPVILADAPGETAVAGRKVDMDVRGGQLTTGVFSINLRYSPELFASEIEVRVLARRAATGEPVARMVAGEGLDTVTGVVRLGAQASIVTLRLTANIAQNEQVEVLAVDAHTDQPLGQGAIVQAAVAIDVEGL